MIILAYSALTATTFGLLIVFTSQITYLVSMGRSDLQIEDKSTKL